MARAPASYPTLVQPEPERHERAEFVEEGQGGDLLRDVAARTTLYMHPAAAKTLARYAVEQSGHRSKVKPHDLIISALEDWFQKHGLPGPVRALEPKPSKRKGRR